MRKITLYPYPQSNLCRAFIEPDGVAGNAWPVRRYIEDGRDILEAVVILPGTDATQTYRFLHDGTNWVSTSDPLARVGVIDLYV